MRAVRAIWDLSVWCFLQSRQIHNTNQHNSTFEQLPLLLDGDPGSRRVAPQSGKGLDATFAHDWNPAAVNRNNRELTAGLRFNSPNPLHIHDTVLVGSVQNNLSSLFLQPEAPSWKAERAVECNALLDVAPMLILQLVVQYHAKVDGGRSALWLSDSEQRSSFRNSFQRFGGLL